MHLHLSKIIVGLASGCCDAAIAPGTHARTCGLDAVRTSSSSELFSESLSDGIPSILCMLAAQRAARFVLLVSEVDAGDTASQIPQQNVCVLTLCNALLFSAQRLVLQSYSVRGSGSVCPTLPNGEEGDLYSISTKATPAPGSAILKTSIKSHQLRRPMPGPLWGTQAGMLPGASCLPSRATPTRHANSRSGGIRRCDENGVGSQAAVVHLLLRHIQQLQPRHRQRPCDICSTAPMPTRVQSHDAKPGAAVACAAANTHAITCMPAAGALCMHGRPTCSSTSTDPGRWAARKPPRWRRRRPRPAAPRCRGATCAAATPPPPPQPARNPDAGHAIQPSSGLVWQTACPVPTHRTHNTSHSRPCSAGGLKAAERDVYV